MLRSPETRGYDRYKASSYRAYNYKLPERYDSSIVVRLFRPEIMDVAVVEELRGELEAVRILDVGCATGRLLRALADAGARSLSGTDLAPRILEVARQKLEGAGVTADLRPADAETELPWPDSSFDVVTMTGVLHHFAKPEDALGEIARVLRTEGRLVLSDPCFFTPLRQALNLCLLIHPHEGDYRFYSRDQAAGLLELEGWVDVRVRPIGRGFYIAVAARPRQE